MYACATIVKKKHRAADCKTNGFDRNSTSRKSRHDNDIAKGPGMCPTHVDFAARHSIYICRLERNDSGGGHGDTGDKV